MIQVVLIEKQGNTRRRYNANSKIQIEYIDKPSVLNNDNLIELSKQVLREIKLRKYPQSIHGYEIYDEEDNLIYERYDYSFSVNDMSELDA